MTRKRRKMKKGGKIFLIFIFLLILSGGIYYAYTLKVKDDETKLLKNKEALIKDINNHYSKFVITNKETSLYDDKGNKIGKISKDINLELADITIDETTNYFKIKNIDNHYIKYSDVSKAEEITKNDRYKKYIPYNKNVSTENKVTFYNQDKSFMYELNTKIDLPLIVKDKDYYGVEYDNQLLYVKKDDVKLHDNHNTDKRNTNGAAVLNYHFFYDENVRDEVGACQEEICASKKQFRSHLEYFKNNNILPITMNELEMYMDGKIQLPKSVLITIDDGGRTKAGIDLLTEYKMMGTIFLITSWYNPKDYYKTDYIELHSHSHNLHNGGKCPGGQGGEIKCLDKSILLDDLKKSREALGGSTAFCYPFYEYNDYSTNILKEAGFTMAFIGEVRASYGPYKLAEVGGDKMHIPRFVVVTYTSMADFNQYFGEIHEV